VVVSITVFDEAPTKVTLSTLLKSSVPWGVAMGIVSTIWGEYFLAKWEALWRKFVYEVGATGQTGLAGSSVTSGKSRRAWR